MQFDLDFPRDLTFGETTPAGRHPQRKRQARATPEQQLEFFHIDRSQQHTFFFAVLAEQHVCAAVDRVRDAVAPRSDMAAPSIPVSRLHMSLMCLRKRSQQPLNFDDEQEIVNAARYVRCEPFDLALDRARTFRPSTEIGEDKRPIVLTPSNGLGLRQLHDRLYGVLERARIIGSRPRAFTPHMTMFYDAVVVDEPVEPISLAVREFHFIHSLHGKSQYRIVASFPLRG